MNIKLFAAIFALMAASASNALTLDELRGASVIITNSSSYKITHVYFNGSNETNWGSDKLGTSTLPTGYRVTLSGVVRGKYDLKLRDEDGDECVIHNISVMGDRTVDIDTNALIRCEQAQ